MDPKQKPEQELSEQPKPGAKLEDKVKVKVKPKDKVEPKSDSPPKTGPEPESAPTPKETLRQDSTEGGRRLNVDRLEYERLLKAVAEDRTRCREFERENVVLVEENEKLEEQIKKLNNEVQEKAGKIQKLKKRISKRRSYFSTSSASSFDTIEPDLSEDDSTDLEQAKEELKQLTDTCNNYLETLLVAQRRAEDLERENQALSDENEEIIPLKLRNSQLEEQVKILDSEITESTNELMRLVEVQRAAPKIVPGLDLLDTGDSRLDRPSVDRFDSSRFSTSTLHYRALHDELLSTMSAGSGAFPLGLPTTGSGFTTPYPPGPRGSGNATPLPSQNGSVVPTPRTSRTGNRPQRSLTQGEPNVSGNNIIASFKNETQDSRRDDTKYYHQGTQTNFPTSVDKPEQSDALAHVNDLPQTDSKFVKDNASEGINRSHVEDATKEAKQSPADNSVERTDQSNEGNPVQATHRSYMGVATQTNLEPDAPYLGKMTDHQPNLTPIWMWLVHASLVLMTGILIIVALKERALWRGANETTRQKLSWINGDTSVEPNWLVKVHFTKQELLGVGKGRLG